MKLGTRGLEPPRTLDLGIWAKAALAVPRLTDSERWARLGAIRRWLVTARAISFPMTLLSALLAGAFSARGGTFQPILWVLLLLGLIAAHATNNLLNDLIDHGKGVDVRGYFRHDYASNPLDLGLLSVAQMWRYAVGTGLFALAVGAFFVYLRGPIALALLALGAVFVVFYTYPFKYIGLGEPIVLLVWGPLMVGGGTFVVTGQWRWEVVLAGIPYGLVASTVLFGKHIEKLEPDRAKRIFTLPVILGERRARMTSIALMAASYGFTLAGIVLGLLPPSVLIVLLGLPTFVRAARAYAAPKPTVCPERYPRRFWPAWYVAIAVWHTCTFGALMVVGIGIEVVRRWL